MSSEDKAPFGINHTKRYVSQGAESRLYKIESPANHGEVELVDYMGGDEMVVRVATAGRGTRIFPEHPDQKEFLTHLAASGIYDPFSAVQLKLSMQVPIRAGLEFVYDRSGSVNEYSGRYSTMINSARIPTVSELERSGMSSVKAQRAHEVLVNTRLGTRESYDKMLEVDFARELARSGLGTNNDTRFYWLMDLPSLASFVLKERKKLSSNDPTRDYVESVAEIARSVAPDSWDALMVGGDKLNLTMPKDEEVVDHELSRPSWGQGSTKRVVVPELEDKLFTISNFLDHGQFQPVDYMGDDTSLAQAARTSYGDGTKKLSEDRALIRSLIRDAHTSPIEMARLAFESRTPVFTDPRQAARHRTLKQHGFMGETPIGNLFYQPQDSELKYQDRSNRQGRGKSMESEDIAVVRRELARTEALEMDAVRVLRELGTPEDTIRDQKGVGFYTVRWRLGDPHNLGQFLRLRLDAHAQMEVRVFASEIEGAVKAHTPIVHGATRDYVIDSMRLSAAEITHIRENGLPSDADLESTDFFDKSKVFTLKKDEKSRKLSREGEGFKGKLKRLKK
ncbi:MAG: FAD-dependent thymidylate synthase [Candidatus Pacearchaeota archaeon]